MAWTIVQHSGHSKPGFRKGLEEAPVSVNQASKVRLIGGRVFDDYNAAADYCMEEQYQADNTGVYPNAPGTFAAMVVDGHRVYVPRAGKL